MKLFKKLALAAVAAVAMVQGVNAAVINPIGGLYGIDATAGYTASYLFTSPDDPANQNPATIKTFLETLLPAQGTLTDGQSANCGAAGFSCSGGTSGSSSFLGNIFAVHIGNGELVFVYNTLINNFSITVPSGALALATGGDSNGGGLSNIRVFTGDPGTDVPLPGAAILLLSGLGGLGAVRRMRNQKVA